MTTRGTETGTETGTGKEKEIETGTGTGTETGRGKEIENVTGMIAIGMTDVEMGTGVTGERTDVTTGGPLAHLVAGTVIVDLFRQSQQRPLPRLYPRLLRHQRTKN